VRVEDEQRRVVWRADIDPYGHATIDPESSIALHLRFPGHYFDEETGLHYNRHRYYSPRLARYIQRDPIDIDGGLNVYAYTPRPLQEVDIDGLACPPEKPIIFPADDENFQKKQDEATVLAAQLREQLENTPTGRFREDGTPIMAHENMTMAVLVVQRNGKYEIVVTSSTGPGGIPPAVQGTIGEHPVVYPPARSGDTPRYDRTSPRTGEAQDAGLHAEQRGMRWADSDDSVTSVASVTPTRRCCDGCEAAIAARGDPTGQSATPAGYLH
jgi:RHS repeat-associated protein